MKITHDLGRSLIKFFGIWLLWGLLFVVRNVSADSCLFDLIDDVLQLQEQNRSVSITNLAQKKDACDPLQLRAVRGEHLQNNAVELTPGRYRLDRHLRKREAYYFKVRVNSGQLVTIQAASFSPDPRVSAAANSVSAFSLELSFDGDSRPRRININKRTPLAESKYMVLRNGYFIVRLGNNIDPVHRNSVFSISVTNAFDGELRADANKTNIANWVPEFRGTLGLEDKRDIIAIGSEHAGRTLTVHTNDEDFSFTLGTYGADRKLINSAKGKGQVSLILPTAKNLLLAIKNTTPTPKDRPRYREPRRLSTYSITIQDFKVSSTNAPDVGGSSTQEVDKQDDAAKESSVRRGEGYSSDREARADFVKRYYVRSKPVVLKPYQPQNPIDKDTLFRTVKAIFLGGEPVIGEQPEMDHLLLMEVFQRMSEFSPAQREELRPLLLPPDHKESVFHPSRVNWSKLLQSQSYLESSKKIETNQEPNDNLGGTIVLPTKMCRGQFLIPLTLAPRGSYSEDRTLWLLFDTGAGATYIDPDSIERTTGRRFTKDQRVNIRNATTGGFEHDPIRIRFQEFDHFSRILGRHVDGIMGFTVFKHKLLTLDYSKNQIRLNSGQLPPPDGETIFDADGPDYRPWISVKFPDRSELMLIDSGAARFSLVVRQLESFQTQLPPRLADSATRMRDIELRLAARSSANAHIGPHILATPTLLSTSGTQLLGGQVMQNFIWTFDQSTKRVRLVRHGHDSPIVFEPIYGHGMILSYHEEGFRVENILASTPASNANVRIGDIITHWNGVTAIERGCKPAKHTSITLKIKRDELILDAVLEYFPLVN